VEGAKHLIRGEVGAVVGLAAIPELRTLRERLSAIAQGSDPLGVHRALAAVMLAADACPLLYEAAALPSLAVMLPPFRWPVTAR